MKNEEQQKQDIKKSFFNNILNKTEKQNKRKINPFVSFGVFALFIAFVSSFFSSSTRHADADKISEAINTGYSQTLSAGAIIMLKDSQPLASRDMTITHSYDKPETKLYVWDYAAEDGDYVQVFVNGVPLSEPFMIKHKPAVFIVPSVGEISIKGIHDGGGGITYAVHWELNGYTYFNTAPTNDFNTYTLVFQ